MKIAVCIKQVPAEYEGSTDMSLGHLIRSGRGRLNPYDGPAIEAALRLKELAGGGAVVQAFSMGPPSAGAVLGEALSMGAIAAWLLTDKAFAGADTLATARALAAGMARVDSYDLIICGLKSTDGDTGQVGPALAAILGRPFVGRVECFEQAANEDSLILRHKVDDCTQTVYLSLPAVISVTRAFVPRIPGLKARLAKKIFHEIHLSDLANRDENLYGLKGSPTRIKRAYVPERANAGQVREASGTEAAAIILKELSCSSSRHPGEGRDPSSVPKASVPNSPDMDSGLRRNDGGVLVWLETAKGHLTPLARELAAQARRLSAGVGLPALGLVMERDLPPAIELQTLPLGRVFIHQLSEPGFSAQNCADTLLDCIRQCRPAVVLIGASDRGKDVAPLAAASLGTGLTADCVDLRLEDADNLLQIRPAFGGNVMAEILTPCRRPQFATVRPGAFRADCTAAAPSKLCPLKLSAATKSALKILEIQPAPPRALAGAQTIIAVGRGFKSAADIAPIQALAAAFGAELGGSRAVVERGWLPPEAQIGLSGHSVAPRLLITLGISGSVQFMAGIRGAERIVAVNSDPLASIFSVAHNSLCADIYQILPALEKWLREKE